MHVPFKPPSLQATRSQNAAKKPCLFVAWWSSKVKDFDGLAFSGGWPAKQQGCERRRIWPCPKNPKIAWDLSDEGPGMWHLGCDPVASCMLPHGTQVFWKGSPWFPSFKFVQQPTWICRFSSLLLLFARASAFKILSWRTRTIGFISSCKGISLSLSCLIPQKITEMGSMGSKCLVFTIAS